MAAESLELFVHFLCPFAQRTLYTLCFKSLPATIIQVSLASPPAWYLEINPLKQVPALQVTRNGKLFRLTESLVISEYFDSFPGPALYPRLANGSVDPLQKALIDAFIQGKISELVSATFLSRNTNPDRDTVAEFAEIINEISQNVENGKFVMHKIIGKNEICFADLMMLSFVERLWVYREMINERFREAVDMKHLWMWYDKISKETWAEKFRAEPRRLINLARIMKGENYRGLDLPLTQYD
jgi:glutathione S-transferase